MKNYDDGISLLRFRRISFRLGLIASLAVVAFLMALPTQAVTCTSTLTGDWSSTVWDAACNGGTVPAAGDTIIIGSGTTIANPPATIDSPSLTINGTLEAGVQAVTLTGDLDITSTGVLHFTSFWFLTVNGNVTLNGAVTQVSSGGVSMAGTSVTLSGSGTSTPIFDIAFGATVALGATTPSLNNLTVGGDLDFAGATLDVNGKLDGGGNIDLNSGELKLGGDYCMGDCSAPALAPGSGLVTYDGTGTQVINTNVTYWDLAFDASPSGSDGLYTYIYGYTINVDNNVTFLPGADVGLDGASIDGGGTATMSMQAGSTLSLGDDGLTGANFPTNFASTPSLDPASTVIYNAGNASFPQTISTDVTYGNLIVTAPILGGGSITKAVTGTASVLSVAGDLTVQDDPGASPPDTVVLDLAANGKSLDVGDDVQGDGSLLFSGTADSMSLGGSLLGGTLTEPATATFSGTGVLDDATEMVIPSEFQINHGTWSTLNITEGPYQLNQPTTIQALSLDDGQTDVSLYLDIDTHAVTTQTLHLGQNDRVRGTGILTVTGDGSALTDDVTGGSVSVTPAVTFSLPVGPATTTIRTSGVGTNLGGGAVIDPGVTLLNTGNLAIQTGLSGSATGAVLDNDGIFQINGPIDLTFLTVDFSTPGNRVTYFGTNGYTIVDVPYASLFISASNGGIGGDGNLDINETFLVGGLKTFDALGGTHSIGGDMNINSGATLIDSVGGATYIFDGTGAQTLLGPAPVIDQAIVLQNNLQIAAASNVTMNGALNLGPNVLTVLGTSLTLGTSSNVSASTGYIDGPVNQLFNAGQTKTLPLGAGGVSMPVTITVDSTTGSPASMEVTAFTSPGPSAPVGSLDAYWQITPTNVGQADVTLTYDQSDVTGTESSLVPARWDGSQWIIQNGSCDTTTNTCTINNVTQFSPWTLVPNACGDVVSTADSGPGTLRQAIIDVNAGGCSAINFAIPGVGPHTITLASNLPDLTASNVVIDGFTQPGSSANTGAFGSAVDANYQVIITGSPTIDGIRILGGGNNVVKGFTFTGLRFGVASLGPGTNNTTIAGNAFLSSQRGVSINSPGSLVGGSTPADRNTFDGMSGEAIFLGGSITAEGNYIGFGPTGSVGSGNASSGILMTGGTSNTVTGNVISNSGLSSGRGVDVSSGSNVISNNRIGTNLAGTSALPNGSSSESIGIAITGGSNTISGNVISGHDQGGIGSVEAGIYVDSAANNIYDNKIGTDAAGTGSIPNRYGIMLGTGATNNVIGGGLGANTIMNNTLDGIAAMGGSGNKWFDNVISANGGIAIDLDDDGADTNDAGDADAGANGKQNFPTITSAVIESGTLYTTVSVDSSTPNPAAIRVEIVQTDVNGQVNASVGSVCVAGSVLANAPVDVPVGSVTAGSLIAAIATSYLNVSCTATGDGSSEVGPSFTAIANTPPVAGDDTGTVFEDSSGATNVQGNDSDAQSSVSIVSWTNGSNGTADCSLYPTCSYTPNPDFSGSDSFTYTIQDAQSATATATVTFTVNPVNDAPSFVVGGIVTVNEDSGAYSATWATSVSAGPANEAAQTLTFLVSNDNNALFSVQPAISAGGTLTFTPATDAAGSAIVSVTLQDNGGTANGGIDTSSTVFFDINVTAVNDPPVANPDSATTSFQTPVTVPVLSNDTDIDGGALTITGSTNGANGTVTCTTTDCTYTPNAGFSGSDSFTYTVSDGAGGSAVGTVTITVSAAVTTDLEITKSGPATGTRAQAVTFTITVKNLGPGDAFDVEVLDPEPIGLLFASNSGDCTTVFPCFLGTVPAGSTKTIQSTYVIRETAPQTVTNVATVTSTSTDTNAANDSASASVDTCPLTPSNLMPLNLESGVPLSGQLTWSNAGATEYVVLLGPGASGCTTEFGRSSANSLSYSGLEPNTQYQWKVVATKAGCIEVSSGCQTFTTGAGACPTTAPTLVSPLVGASISNPVVFLWTPVDQAVGYDVIVDQGAGSVIVASTTTETTATVALTPGAATWSVEAKFDGCPPTRSTSVSFTVEGGDCSDEAPLLQSPVAGASGLSSPVTFQWTSVLGASSYRVWVEAEDSFPVVVGTTSTTTLTAAVPSGSLNWYVQALIAGCPPTISEVRPLQVTPESDCPSGVPSLVAPATGAELDSPITFEWTSVPGAIRYAVWASINDDTESIIGTTEGESSTSLERRMEPGVIDWFVEVFFDGCPSLKTGPQRFTVNDTFTCVTEAPQLTLPVDGASHVDGLVRFQWSAVPTANGYRLWLRTDGVGSFELAGSTLAETELEVPVRGNLVEWYVEAVFNGCPATRSSTSSFELEPPLVCNDTASQLIAPVDGITVTQNRVNLIWTAVDGAVAYNVWAIHEDGVPSRVGLTAGDELEVEVDLEEGVHEWWVTALFAGCNPVDSLHEMFDVDLGFPDECDTESELLLLSPSEGSANIESPVIFEWTAVPDATGYQIWVLEGANDTPRRLGGIRQETQAVVQTNVGTIRWYVEATREGCPPIRSAIEHFKVKPSGLECDIPDKPVLFVPQLVASGTTYRVSWDQVPGSTVYEVQESTSRVFRGLPVRVVRGTSTTFMHVVNAGTEQFFYRVRAIGDCNGERGSYSQVETVTVDGNAGGTGASAIHLTANGSIGSETIELNKDAYSQSGIEEFTVVLRSPTGEPETVRITSDQDWLTVDPEVVTLTAGGVQVTIRADLRDLPLGASQATLRFEPVAGKSTSQTTTTTVTTSLITPTTSTGKNEPLPESLILPAVAHTDGVNSTWLSDIRLTNVGAVTQKYQLNFTPSGMDGTENGESTTIDVQPGSTVALNDILANWYGAVGVDSDETGTLEIRPLKSSTSSSIGGLSAVASGGFTSLASSRTYNFTPGGTFGQFIPAIRFESFVGAGTDGNEAPRLSLQQVSQSSAFRTNLGLVEASGQAVDVLIKVFDSGGTEVGSFNMSLLPGEHKQVNSVLEEQGISVENGRIEVTAANGNGKLMAYGSVVDNQTGDPQLVRAVTLGTDSGNKWVLPGVADLDTGQASWRTDARILNADGTPRRVRLTYYPQNDPGTKSEATIDLQPGEIAVLDDLLATFFSQTNTGGVVHVETDQTANIVTTGRTYNKEESGGTFGQFIPAVNAAQAVGNGERALQILQVEQSDRFRANLGLTEVTGQTAQVEISAAIPGSKVTPKAVVNLDGNEFTQLVGVLSSLGISEAYNARISVRVVGGSGRVVAYGSIVDNQTQDPTYVPAQ